MEFEHKPIMVAECMELLAPQRGGIFADGTLGGGGHSGHILSLLPHGKLYGIDRDQDAINAASAKLLKFGEKFSAVKGNFFDAPELLKERGVLGLDGMLIDLGVSSYQLDNKERGFSYMEDARLDMRMDKDNPYSAYDVINGCSYEELFKIINNYGEEKWASRIAKFIIQEREQRRIESTLELVDIIKSAIPASARRNGPHPAKRTFQAIRIEVNGELEKLGAAIEGIVDFLNPAGRLAVITFHSLEDRIVKQIFQKLENPCTCPKKIPICICGKVQAVKKLNRKPISADEQELLDNPRARSAKLRCVEKIQK